MDNKDLVLKALADSSTPLKAGESSEKLGLDAKEVDKAIKALKKEEKIISPKKCYYSVNK